MLRFHSLNSSTRQLSLINWNVSSRTFIFISLRSPTRTILLCTRSAVDKCWSHAVPNELFEELPVISLLHALTICRDLERKISVWWKAKKIFWAARAIYNELEDELSWKCLCCNLMRIFANCLKIFALRLRRRSLVLIYLYKSPWITQFECLRRTNKCWTFANHPLELTLNCAGITLVLE